MAVFARGKTRGLKMAAGLRWNSNPIVADRNSDLIAAWATRIVICLSGAGIIASVLSTCG